MVAFLLGFRLLRLRAPEHHPLLLLQVPLQLLHQVTIVSVVYQENVVRQVLTALAANARLRWVAFWELLHRSHVQLVDLMLLVPM